MFDQILILGTTLIALGVVAFPLRAWLRPAIPAPITLIGLGMLVGPHAADLLPGSWLDHQGPLAKAAFVVLLLRAGVGLPLSSVRRVLVPALTLGLVPVAAELAAAIGVSRTLGLFQSPAGYWLCGFLVAAVSPAVILPIMLRQKDLHRGEAHLVPDRIIGQTLVNAFVAQTGILFVLDALDGGTAASLPSLLVTLPLSVAGGLIVGASIGALCRIDWLLRRVRARTVALWATAGTALLTALFVYFGCARLGLENVFATLAFGVVLRRRLQCDPRAELKKVWDVAEIVLFVNLGSMLDLSRMGVGVEILLLLCVIGVALAARVLVAAVVLSRSELDPHERRYVTAAHLPKATIQAVFGALPLITFTERGLDHLIADGQTLVVLAAVAVVATAPLGSVILERWGERCLQSSRRRASSESLVTAGSRR